jgi:5-methyltetrahydrofolate--homocysteine methyltransferase
VANLDELAGSIEAGDRGAAIAHTKAALAAGVPTSGILDAMTGAMADVGARFQRGELYVPEMLIAARAMKGAMAILEPELTAAGIRPIATAVLGTVSGDLHDVGKNLVAMMWRGANIEVVDLGTNVPPERFVEAARAHDAGLIGVSALLTTTMVGMRDVVDAVRGAGLHLPVVVGGAPVTAEFATQIGADGYAPDAGGAVDLVKALLRR